MGWIIVIGLFMILIFSFAIGSFNIPSWPIAARSFICFFSAIMGTALYLTFKHN